MLKGSAKGSKRGSSLMKALPSSGGSTTALSTTSTQIKRKGSFKKNTKFNEDINKI
jgi:hypothetical protein